MTEFTHMPLDKKSYTEEEIKKQIKEHNVKFIQLQFVDINGHVKNMAVPSAHIDKVLQNEIMLDGSSIKGFRSIETSDMFFYPDKNSFQILRKAILRVAFFYFRNARMKNDLCVNCFSFNLNLNDLLDKTKN